MIKNYAFVNVKNVILNVVVIDPSAPVEFFNQLAEQMTATAWYDLETFGEAGPGGFFDPIKNKLFPASPHNNWVWDNNSEKWVAPIPYPDPLKPFVWNDSAQNWEEVTDGSLLPIPSISE